MEKPRPRPDIPTAVRIIAWFEIIGGGLAAMSGLILIARGGWLLLAPGGVAILGGWGLLRGKLWGYFLVLAIASLNVVLASPLLTGTVSLFTLIINAAILLVLLGGRSRAWAESLRAR